MSGLFALVISIFSLLISLGYWQFCIRNIRVDVKVNNFARLFLLDGKKSDNNFIIYVANYANRDILMHIRSGYVIQDENNYILIPEQYHTLKASKENRLSIKTDSGCNYKVNIKYHGQPELKIHYDIGFD